MKKCCDSKEEKKCVKNKKKLIQQYLWFDGKTYLSQKKMDYRITYGLIWALVLVASTCSAYIDEQDMRGKFFILNFSHQAICDRYIFIYFFYVIQNVVCNEVVQAVHLIWYQTLIGFNVQGNSIYVI